MTNLIKENKMLTVIIAALVGGGGITTFGYVVDRPAMVSEIIPIFEQSQENRLHLLIIQRADIRKRLWFLEDKISEKGINEDRKTRLWELRNEYDRLENEIARIVKEGDKL